LFGQPELDENLNQTNIRQLRERITHSFNLAPLQSDEVGEYLIFRLRAAGYFGPHLFAPAAIKKISNAAQGLVRRVNILADKSLLAAYADNVYQITPKHVQAAIADSEFGMEQAKVATKQHQIFMWAGLLAIGLALGLLVSNWQQIKANKAAKQPEISAKGAANLGKTGNNQNKPMPLEAAPVLAVQAAGLQDDILAKRLNVTQTWLASQAPATVSIQLMGASSDAQLRLDLQALSQQIELDNIYVYRTKVNDLPFLTVLYGSFASRLEATQALQTLPAEIQKNRPQLRTIAGVLQETK
jgi:MSHA biogenesis protein MshM